MKYWLMKTEPSCYSVDDLMRDGVSMWDDVRNYQARNFIRDEMENGDRVLFYHSNTKPIGIAGVAEISGSAYSDPTQFDSSSYKFDDKSTKSSPRWFAIDVKFIARFSEPVTLTELKRDPFFDDMLVTQKGMRLSVQPVAKKHFIRIVNLSNNR
ncbi:MAG: EVE domain-containing protein [Candidatus Pacebacteria bacterium]|nr:EVE domain-containing protein [Candidatus Paceibacterota bacterium]MCF7857109.1 EVE domain-containing protein [Candidatus Paceibacterota bacterium]